MIIQKVITGTRINKAISKFVINTGDRVFNDGVMLLWDRKNQRIVEVFSGDTVELEDGQITIHKGQ